jgi:hypothetical protein
VYLTVVTLIAVGDDAGYLDAAVVQDVIWAFAVSETRLEHVRVAENVDGMDIVFLSIAENAERSRNAAVEVCRFACEHSPSLRGWTVVTSDTAG